MADGKRRHNPEEPKDGPSQEQQPDDEQDVIRSDRNVMDAGRSKRFEHRQGALPSARVVLTGGVCPAENLLMLQDTFFIHVHEGLVVRIVRKQRGTYREMSDRHTERHTIGDFNGRAFWSSTSARL